MVHMPRGLIGQQFFTRDEVLEGSRPGLTSPPKTRDRRRWGEQPRRQDA